VVLDTKIMRDAAGYVPSDIQDAVAEDVRMRSSSAAAQEEKWLKLQATLKTRAQDADDGRWIEADDFDEALKMYQIDADAAPVRSLTQRCSIADGRVDFQQFLILSRGPGPRPADQPSPEAVRGVVRKGTLSKLGGKQKDKWQTRYVELSIGGGLKCSSGSALRDIVSGSLQLSPAQIVSVSHYADIGVDHAFEVVSLAKAGKVYKFKAESGADCNAWIQGIRDCIDAHRVIYLPLEAFTSRPRGN
jgi:hypothetical protein